MKLMRQGICALLCWALMLSSTMTYAADANIPIPGATSYLLVEVKDGTVLLHHNENESRAMASITKLMTVLLILEDIDSGKLSLTDQITASANAEAMDGSQIDLKENEVMDLDTMLKSILVASANDACVAMAEHISGSETAFVKQMNLRAKKLGLTNTSYQNSHGLDEDGHYSSAKDIAVLAKELLKHDTVKNYTGIWQDRIRDGKYLLTNTNKLIHDYKGATGLKTGSTTKAGSCLVATAERNGMELLAVVLNSPTAESRFSDAKMLLDYGFQNYTVTPLASSEEVFTQGKIRYGKEKTVDLYPKEDLQLFSKKGEEPNATSHIELYSLKAPIPEGTACGKLYFEVDKTPVKETDLIVKTAVRRQSFWDTVKAFFQAI